MKVGLAYGPASGRNVQPDFPSSGLDIQTKVDEYRIVGPHLVMLVFHLSLLATSPHQVILLQFNSKKE